MLELLIYREPHQLVKADGKAFIDSDAPEFLKMPLVIDRAYVEHFEEIRRKDLLIYDPSEKLDFTSMNSNQIGGVWSGCRSSLVSDPDTGKLYKLKGVAVDVNNPELIKEDDNIRFLGGHKRAGAVCERTMIKRYNKVLENEGIEPVMVPKGFWTYDVQCGRMKPAASVFEVKGDTRLDELMFVVNSMICNKHFLIDNKLGGFIPEGTICHDILEKFFGDVGFVVGRLKRLMDRSGQSWSSDYRESNAHTGNVVLYRDGGKLKVNLVDFDMSCDARDFSRTKLNKMQAIERKTLLATVNSLISMRRVNHPIAKSVKNRIYYFVEFGRNFSSGFAKGYESRSRNYSNEVSLDDLLDSFCLLRSNCMFSVDPKTDQKDLMNRYLDWAFDDAKAGLRHTKGVMDRMTKMLGYSVHAW